MNEELKEFLFEVFLIMSITLIFILLFWGGVALADYFLGDGA